MLKAAYMNNVPVMCVYITIQKFVGNFWKKSLMLLHVFYIFRAAFFYSSQKTVKQLLCNIIY